MHWSFFETFVQTGCLTVIAPDGRQRHFGQGNPAAAIEFSDAGCLSVILRNPEMNLGRTYVEGRWRPAAQSDLHSVLHVLRVNFEKTLSLTPLVYTVPIRHRPASLMEFTGCQPTQCCPPLRLRRKVISRLSGSRHALFLRLFSGR